MIEEEKLSANDLSKLQRLIQFNDAFISIGNVGSAKLQEDNYPVIFFVFIGFYNRFIDSLQSVNILLQHYPNIRNVETSIGLTIRASLLDYLIMIYLGTYEREIDKADIETEKRFDNALTGFLCDQLRHSIQHLELAHKSGVVGDEIFYPAVKNFYDRHQPFFTHFDQDNLTKCLKGKRFSVKDVFNRIYQDKALKHLSVVYDFYVWYSKYDHFGISTNEMQTMDISEEVERMHQSIEFIFQGIINSILKIAELKPAVMQEAYALQIVYKKFRQS